MNLLQIPKEDRERAKADHSFFLKLLEKQYEETKEHMLDLPLDQLPELRGRAKALRFIIKLLS